MEDQTCTGNIKTCKLNAGECVNCSERDCPDKDPMHYHHDGCPSCTSKPLSCPLCEDKLIYSNVQYRCNNIKCYFFGNRIHSHEIDLINSQISRIKQEAKCDKPHLCLWKQGYCHALKDMSSTITKSEQINKTSLGSNMVDMIVIILFMLIAFMLISLFPNIAEAILVCFLLIVIGYISILVR